MNGTVTSVGNIVSIITIRTQVVPVSIVREVRVHWRPHARNIPLRPLQVVATIVPTLPQPCGIRQRIR